MEYFNVYGLFDGDRKQPIIIDESLDNLMSLLPAEIRSMVIDVQSFNRGVSDCGRQVGPFEVNNHSYVKGYESEIERMRHQ